MTTNTYAPLRLKKNEERRLRAGHVWVFSNEIDTRATPLDGFEPGAAVEIQDAAGKVLGTGYANPHSLICARLVSRDPRHPFSASLLVHRIKVALSLRERLYSSPYYRLVYGEADGLPGLVVDRYADLMVVQITTAGMEALRDEIVSALHKVLQPTAVLLRNDGALRDLEGLGRYTEVASGDMPAQAQVQENGCWFEVDLQGGQKTGWFYDHRDNRARLGRYVHGLRVLDVFSYVGAWGVQAAAAGAAQVVCLDSSANALQRAAENAARNHVGDRLSTLMGDAFESLRALREAREQFDVVILDPPAFIKRRKDAREGAEAYRRMNELAIRILAKDGILVSASCSYHFAASNLRSTLQRAARHLDRHLSILEQGFQGPDHPIHPAIPETEYLKAFYCRVLPA